MKYFKTFSSAQFYSGRRRYSVDVNCCWQNWRRVLCCKLFSPFCRYLRLRREFTKKQYMGVVGLVLCFIADRRFHDRAPLDDLKATPNIWTVGRISEWQIPQKRMSIKISRAKLRAVKEIERAQGAWSFAWRIRRGFDMVSLREAVYCFVLRDARLLKLDL